MSHKASEILQKAKVINSKAEELERLIAYMTSRKLFIKINLERLEVQKDFLISEIQELCRDVADDTGDTANE